MPKPFTAQELLDAVNVAPEHVRLHISNIIMARRLDQLEEVTDEVQDEE